MKKEKLSALLILTLVLSGCASSQKATSAHAGERNSASRSSQTATEISRPSEAAKSNSNDESKITLSLDSSDPARESESMQVVDGLTYVDGILLVNKKHGVPADYAPGVDPTAQAKCSELIGAMQAQGLDVGSNTSSYRSYGYQSELYSNYVAANGQEQADTFSARPGYSEHQTGLAFDLLDGSGQLLTSSAEAQWLLDHAAKYGFIVRYQEGKEAITGYQAEPWHIRYIGERAPEIAASGLTLEEYLQAPGGDYIQ